MESHFPSSLPLGTRIVRTTQHRHPFEFTDDACWQGSRPIEVASSTSSRAGFALEFQRSKELTVDLNGNLTGNNLLPVLSIVKSPAKKNFRQIRGIPVFCPLTDRDGISSVGGNNIKRKRGESQGVGGLCYPGNSALLALEILLREKRSRPKMSSTKKYEPYHEKYRKQNRNRVPDYV